MNQTVVKFGEVVPQFEANGIDAANEDFKFSLSDTLKENDYLVIFFYPGDFTFVCHTEVTGFSEKLPEFKGLNTSVVAISTDSHHVHRAWKSTNRSDGGLGEGIDLPLLSDKNHAISRLFGVLNDNGNANRGLFIIEKSGKLVYSLVSPDGVGRSAKETLRVLRAIRFTAEHGEVCPLNWELGGKTMQASTEGLKNFLDHEDSKKSKQDN